MLSRVRIRVWPADGSPPRVVDVGPDGGAAIGRDVSPEDAPSVRTALGEALEEWEGSLHGDLRVGRVGVLGLPDAPRSPDAPVLQYVTSARALLVLPMRNRWVLVNPSTGSPASVRGWAKPPSTLRPRGGLVEVADKRTAVWIPSNLGPAHLVTLELLDVQEDSLAVASESTLPFSHLFTEANKRVLVFFFEEYVRWDPPVPTPVATGRARDRVRALRAGGVRVPEPGELNIFKARLAEDTLNAWSLPETAEQGQHLRTLELAVDLGQLRFDDAGAILARYDDAALARRAQMAELVAAHEDAIVAQLADDPGWHTADGEQQRSWKAAAGRLVGFALEQRSVGSDRPAAVVPTLQGLTVAGLQAELRKGNRQPPVEVLLSSSQLEVLGRCMLGLG